MSKKPEWEKDLTKQNLFDKLHLSIEEISELGIAWLIMAAIILVITGFNLDLIFVYLIVFGISFFTHELSHKFTAIKFGARAYFKISKDGLMFTLISLIIGFPILAVGAVFWWGEAAYSARLRGRVSAAGPISNIILAGIFYIILGISILLPLELIELAWFLHQVGIIGVWLNTFLGLFNLLPIGMLDGAKILAWDGRIWAALVGTFIVIGFFGGGFFIIGLL